MWTGSHPLFFPCNGRVLFGRLGHEGEAALQRVEVAAKASGWGWRGARRSVPGGLCRQLLHLCCLIAKVLLCVLNAVCRVPTCVHAFVCSGFVRCVDALFRRRFSRLVMRTSTMYTTQCVLVGDLQPLACEVVAVVDKELATIHRHGASQSDVVWTDKGVGGGDVCQRGGGGARLQGCRVRQKYMGY